MKAILQFLARERVWPLVVAVLGALIILPGLGSHGFWEPQEIRIADNARDRAGLDAEGNEQQDHPQNRGAAESVRPPLTEWSAGQGMKLVSADEFGARLPLALLALLAVVATFFLGRRLASPRAGLFSALVLLSFPLFLFQSRQLMSDIGAVSGGVITVLGLCGLAWPGKGHKHHPLWLYGVYAALVAVGAVISYYAAAVLLGIVVPFGAVALACLSGLAGGVHLERGGSDAPVEDHRSPEFARRLFLAGIAIVALGLLVLIAATFVDGDTHRAHGLAFWILVPMFLGVVLVLLGISTRAAGPDETGESQWRSWHLAGLGFAAGTTVLIALYVVLGDAFDLRDPVPGEREFLGHSLIPTENPSELLGGKWSLRDDLKSTFDVLYEQIAFGLFPWVVLAPIALAHLALGPRRGRHTFAGAVLFAWATLGWIVASVMARKVDMVLYSAIVPVALAIGVWLDDLVGAREQAEATAESNGEARAGFGIPLRLPLVALFVFLAAVVLSKDILAFPDKLLSVHVLDTVVKYPKDAAVLKIGLKYWVLGFGLLFGAALAFGLVCWVRHDRVRERPGSLWPLGRFVGHFVQLYGGRYGIRAALGIGLVLALFIAQVWTPHMSRKLSSKHTFSVLSSLRAPSDEVGIMGNYGSGPKYYAGGDFERLANRNALLSFLRKENRVFALAPRAELCAIHRAVKGDTSYFVLDDSNAKYLLISNQKKQGESDRNPLARAIVREQPQNIKYPLAVNYDNKVELIGMNIPARVDRGDSFQMTLFFKVLKPVGGNWKIFVHFDGGSMRFQGDHEPIQGTCGTSYWQPGDYIVDTFTVEAGNITYAKTTYGVHTGFFRGSGGNWKNMKVISAETGSGGKLSIGSDDRVRVGQIRVK